MRRLPRRQDHLDHSQDHRRTVHCLHKASSSAAAAADTRER